MKCEPARAERLAPARIPAIALLLLAGSAACANPSTSPNASTAATMPEARQDGAISNLPFSQGRSFATLDEYLEFRKQRGAYDVPWYRLVKPGLYELVSVREPGTEPKVYSRHELARKFGFEK